MKEIINNIIDINYNGLKTFIDNNQDASIIKDVVDGKLPFTAEIIYFILSIICDKTGNNVLLIRLLKKGYFQGKINVFQQALQQFQEFFPTEHDDEFIKEQIEDYEKNYKWCISDKFLFTNNGLGYASLLVIDKLMNSNSLIKEFPNDARRYKHIIENQIYIVDKNPINNLCFASMIDIGNEFKKNIFTGDFLSMQFDRLKWGKFKASLGQSLYSEDNVYKRRSTNFIYHKYILKSISISQITMLITPSRWFQTKSGDFRYLKKFRENMMKSNKITWLNHKHLDTDPKLTGGLSYFIYDNLYEYEGRCYYKNSNRVIDLNKFDIILTEIGYYSLINKVRAHYPITIKYLSSGWSGLKTTDNRLVPNKIRDNDIKVYVSNKSKHKLYNHTNKGCMWISNNYLQQRVLNGLNKWKVLTNETATKGGEAFSSKFRIALPDELFTHTFCGFITNNEEESKNLITYLKTNFVKKLISIRKIKNHINADTLEWVPIVPLNQAWDDDKLATYFKLTDKEKQLING